VQCTDSSKPDSRVAVVQKAQHLFTAVGSYALFPRIVSMGLNVYGMVAWQRHHALMEQVRNRTAREEGFFQLVGGVIQLRETAPRPGRPGVEHSSDRVRAKS
jgi:hypothetical protein